jgi:RNA 2',3'-cyclic 3'-phosphodiesterase
MASGSEGDGTQSGSGNITSTSRIFIALKMAPDIAQELSQMARPLERFAVRPIAQQDIHLTLVPPWNEPAVSNAIGKLRLAVERHYAFTLEFRHVGYGPDPKRPRLVWVDCSTSKELMDLHAALMLAFGQRDERLFLPHVTLARIRGNATRVARRYPIDRDLAFIQEITSVELMQSPSFGGRGYQILASLPLKNPSSLVG